MRFYALMFTVLLSTQLDASERASITRIEGEVQILKNPSKKIKGEPPRMKFQSHFYNLTKAKIGDQLSRLHIIKTGVNGKAKLIYPNGDVVSVGPGSMLKISHRKAKNKETTLITLLMGKFRALIDPEGPRNQTEVKTRNVAMGVRGTDFFVNTHNKKGALEVSVMRGEVRLAVASSKTVEKGLPVATGQVAEINVRQGMVDLTEEMVLRKMEDGDMLAMNDQTTIKNSYGYGESMMALTAKPKSKMEEKMEKLERMAAEAMMKDIKRHQPKKYKKINRKAKTMDQIEK